MSTNKRRQWTAAEKLRIVLAGLDGAMAIGELCRREGISANQYYTWKKQLFGSAARVFAKDQGKPSAREQRLLEENGRLKSVIAEITSENLELKKTF